MKVRSALILIAALVELFAVDAWLVCKNFITNLHYSSFDVFLRVNEAVHNDTGYSVHVVRYFHNKLFLGFDDIITRYLLFWDGNFQALFFSFIGSFGIVVGFWYLITLSTIKYKWAILVVLLVLPLIEVFSIPLPFVVRLILIWVPFIIFSFYGLWQFLKHQKKKGMLIVSIIIIVSILYLLAFQEDIYLHFCYNK